MSPEVILRHRERCTERQADYRARGVVSKVPDEVANRILIFLAAHPGSTYREIAVGLRLDAQTTKSDMIRLRLKGVVASQPREIHGGVSVNEWRVADV